MTSTSRRAFLGVGVFALLGGAAGLWWLRRDAGGVLAPVCLEELLPDPSRALDVGLWYLKQVPGEADIEALSHRVFGERRFRRRDECTAHLRERIRSDYAERRVRRVDGFLISTTELRLYALLSLLGSG